MSIIALSKEFLRVMLHNLFGALIAVLFSVTNTREVMTVFRNSYND